MASFTLTGTLQLFFELHSKKNKKCALKFCIHMTLKLNSTKITFSSMFCNTLLSHIGNKVEDEDQELPPTTHD